MICHPHAPRRDTALLLGRLVRLREGWRLTQEEFQALLGVSEASLVQLAREGREVLAERIETRVRTLDEIASFVARLLAGLDPADWLRTPNVALCGSTPLQTLASDPDGARRMREQLRGECAQAGR